MYPWDLSLAMILTLNFQGQIWNLPYLNQKWCDCHEMKSKHIDWILGIKCNHWVWPWPWPRPWIFKVRLWNSHISGIGGPIDIEQKGAINDHDLLLTKMRCKDLVTEVTSDVGVPSTHLQWCPVEDTPKGNVFGAFQWGSYWGEMIHQRRVSLGWSNIWYRSNIGPSSLTGSANPSIIYVVTILLSF